MAAELQARITPGSGAHISSSRVVNAAFVGVISSALGCSADGVPAGPDAHDVDNADPLPVDAAAGDGTPPENDTPPEDGPHFVWPVSSWIAANDYYASGAEHSGSADFAIQLYAPVYPARHGVVDAVSFSLRGGHGVTLRHEGDSGEVYTTLYTHLAEEPLVEEGDEVDLDTRLGYLGRVGNANFSGPHVHFAIFRPDDEGNRGDRLVIPGLEIGSWVDRGDPIPGDYEGLGPMFWPEHTFDVRVVDDGLRVYESRSRTDEERVLALSAGEVVTVVRSERGQYLVEVGEESGWIPHSGTVPDDSAVFDVQVDASVSANVRREPTTSGDNVIGSLAPDLHLTAYETGGSDDGWSRVLWPCSADTNESDDDNDRSQAVGGCPGVSSFTLWKYGWLGPAVTERDGVFEARTRVEDLEVFGNRIENGENRPDCPCDASSQIGEVEGIRQLVTVEATWNGWYQIDHGGEIGWVRGWYTAGRQ